MHKGQLYVFFLSTFLQNSHRTLKFKQKLLPLQTKISANKTEWRYSQLAFTEKKIIFTSLPSVGKTFSGISGDLNFKIFSFAVHPGDTSWRQ